uniref:SHSP domain-containing protein n=1 Tax=Fagus sylvatica TaxID=28930 RepID=A0A2N9HZZ6_FAGSY
MGLLSHHDNMVGSGTLSRVYESIQNLDSSFLQPNKNKDSELLRPKPAFSSNTHTPQLLLNFVPPSTTTIPTLTPVIVDKTTKPHSFLFDRSLRLRRREAGFRLPENAKLDQVKASMENEVLTVTVPKEEEKKSEAKNIEISG